MEKRKKHTKEGEENKLGILPASEIKGSDADTAYQNELSAEAQSRQAKNSDSDVDHPSKNLKSRTKDSEKIA